MTLVSVKQLIQLGFNLKIPYQNVFLLHFIFYFFYFVGNHLSVENLLCFTGILSSHHCALQVSQQGCQQDRKRFTALYFIYVSQNCLCRGGDMVRKATNVSRDSFHCGETAVAVLLLVSIQRFKNEIFPLVVLMFLL